MHRYYTHPYIVYILVSIFKMCSIKKNVYMKLFELYVYCIHIDLNKITYSIYIYIHMQKGNYTYVAPILSNSFNKYKYTHVYINIMRIL